MDNDKLLATFMQMYIARALEGESQINENIKWDRETKAAVPLAQARTMAVGIIAFIIGLVLFGWNIAWLFELKLTPGDVLLLGMAAATLLIIVFWLSQMVLGWQNKIITLVFAAIFSILVAIAISAAITSTRQRFGWLNVVAISAVPVFLIPGAALTYHQLLALVDPFGKTSPVERMVRPYIPNLFADTQSDDARRLRVPYRINGQVQHTTPTTDRESPPEDTLYHIHPADASLIDFIREASNRGLARRKWIVKNQTNYVLPTTRLEVGRDTYDALIADAIEWGFIAPGGDGNRAHWLIQPADAITAIESEIIAQLGEESD